MLIVKNLKKTYKTKGGVEVKALDDVSITFPENGMVFLLGKSGSGKSTLLNVIGGLDRVDSGEIIVKGKNSKTFSGADYDSYRNTFIGFIFQEYNILNEFNVEQNISLALQLQGKPNDKKAVDDILAQVDLTGLGKRKPNTLSGGQKQRVAIARALIKNPEIIMADEPTGALDSNTGKQVFDTLKKLSKDKLVIVVSHDRDFAEIYGDRIIELSDGKIISDTSKEYVEPRTVSSNVQIINDHTVAINDTSKLSTSDMEEILKTLKKNKGEAVITSGDHDLPLVRQAIHISDNNSTEVFNETGEVQTKEYDGRQTKFIRSKLPMGRAFKMGSSSLKTKPIRLIVTALLTITSLTMFGLVSTLMLFKESYSVYKALKNSDYSSEVIEKRYKSSVTNYNYDIISGEKGESWTYDADDRTYFGKGEIKQMNNNRVGLNYAGLISFNGEREPAYFQIDNSKLTEFYRTSTIMGFCDAGKDYLDHNDLNIIAGTYPTSPDELAISDYQFGVLKEATTGITNENSILNKEFVLYLRGNIAEMAKKFKITAVYSSGSVPEKYLELKEADNMNQERLNQVRDQFNRYLNNSFHLVSFVSANFFETYKDELFSINQNNYYWGGPRFWLRGARFETGWDISKDYIDPNDGRDIGTDKIFPYYTPTFYDVSGNKIDNSNVDLSSGKVYINYNYYMDRVRDQKRDYYNNIREIVDNRSYDAEVKALIDGKEEQYYQLADRLQTASGDDYYRDYAYPEEYNYQEDLQKGEALIENYYLKVMKRSYTFRMADRLIEGFWNRNGDEDSDIAFKNFRAKFDQARSTDPYDLTDYDDIRSYVQQDSEYYLRNRLLIEYLERWWPEESDPDYQVRDNYFNKYNNRENITDSDRDAVKALIQKHVDLGRNETFEYDDSVITKEPPLGTNRVYYVTSNGQGGELELAGYVKDYEYFFGHEYASSLGVIESTTINVEEKATEYKLPEDAQYAFAITPAAFTQAQVDNMLSKNGAAFYRMTDDTYNNIMNYISMIAMLKQVFLIVGLVCGVFAALMLLNFISTSITSKIREIGILRAVGARGGDLFKIFFSESGLIATICSVIAIVASVIICWRLNVMMAKEVGIYLLDFNVLNIVMIIVGAVVITVLGTIIPVAIAAKKPPVDSIRTL